MNYSTEKTLLERFATFFGINEQFHEYQNDIINEDSSIFISPVKAKLVHFGRIEKSGKLISKFGREIDLKESLGERAKLFDDGFYLNFYLSPKDKHYWRIPYDSEVISTKVNNGKAKIPIIVGLEKFFPRTDFFEKAIKQNASIGSIFKADKFYYSMIAVGSLNVNSIHTIKKDYFKKGDIGGYFNLGSSMLLCFSKNSLESLVTPGMKVDIGQDLFKIKNIYKVS